MSKPSYNSKIKLTSLILLAFLFLLPQTIFAQEAVGLGIYPPILEVMLQPGKTITQVYRIINQGQTDLSLISRLVGFVPADTKGGVALQETGDLLAKDYFSFQNADLELGQKFSLKAGQEQQLVLKIKLPPDAPEGDYYRTLLVQTLPDQTQSITGPHSQLQIGGHILLTVSAAGQPHLSSEITNFFLETCSLKLGTWCFVDSFTNPTIQVKLRNTGTAFFKPQGQITAKGLLSPKTTLTLLPENILAGYSRSLKCSQPVSDGSGQVSPLACQLPSQFLLGPYRLRLGYTIPGDPTSSTATFLVIGLPFKLIAGGLVLLAVYTLVRSKLRTNQVQTGS